MANRTQEERLVEVRCGICGDVYSDPVMTPCLHSFCKSCVVKQLEEKGTSSNGSFRCPTCSVVSLLPDGGIKDLPSNLWLAHRATAAVYQQKIESGVGTVSRAIVAAGPVDQLPSTAPTAVDSCALLAKMTTSGQWTPKKMNWLA